LADEAQAEPTGWEAESESTNGREADVEYLDVEDLIELPRRLLGDPPPVRDIGLLGSAAARPQTTVFGADAYPDIWSKAAALLQSILKNQALVDGNKRLGWLATSVFLILNGIDVTVASNDAVHDAVVDIAANDRTIEEMSTSLQRLVGRA
jgi:death on curing protein